MGVDGDGQRVDAGGAERGQHQAGAVKAQRLGAGAAPGVLGAALRLGVADHGVDPGGARGVGTHRDGGAVGVDGVGVAGGEPAPGRRVDDAGGSQALGLL